MGSLKQNKKTTCITGFLIWACWSQHVMFQNWETKWRRWGNLQQWERRQEGGGHHAQERHGQQIHRVFLWWRGVSYQCTDEIDFIKQYLFKRCTINCFLHWYRCIIVCIKSSMYCWWYFESIFILHQWLWGDCTMSLFNSLKWFSLMHGKNVINGNIIMTGYLYL